MQSYHFYGWHRTDKIRIVEQKLEKRFIDFEGIARLANLNLIEFFFF